MSHIRQNDDAMTASVPSPVASTPPLPVAPPSPSPQQSQGDDRFDSQLDVARRQQQPRQDDDRQTSDDNSTPVTQGKTASTDGDKKTTRAADDKSQDDSDDTSLASTMLQLLGQSAPPAADPSAATTQGAVTDPAAAATTPAGMSALALAMPQAIPATDAQATKDPAATSAQAKLAGIPTNVLPTIPKLADLGKAGAADNKAGDKAGDDDWHHVIANATNKTSTATATTTATTKAVQTAETTPTDLPQTAAHKDNDITAMLGLTSGPGGIAHVAQPQVVQMQSSVDSGGFAQELGQQVAWMGGQDIKEARIRLNPESLGELEVKVSVDHNNRVDVAFAAQHPAAVTAVQQTLGQLDTMLAGHGLSLGHTFVGQQHQGSDGSSSSSGKGAFANSDGTDGDVEVSPIRQVAVGLVDMFA
jgi:flagellar hook-length control protein FliK